MWVIKEVGDKMVYNKDSGAVQYNNIVVKNQRWNGFLCTAKVIFFILEW